MAFNQVKLFVTAHGVTYYKNWSHIWDHSFKAVKPRPEEAHPSWVQAGYGDFNQITGSGNGVCGNGGRVGISRGDCGRSGGVHNNLVHGSRGRNNVGRVGVGHGDNGHATGDCGDQSMNHGNNDDNG